MLTNIKNISEKCGVDLQCRLTQTVVDGADEMRYTTYGIRVCNQEDGVVLELPDISTDRAFVERFLYLCEKYHVALLHIGDILDDMMC